jgi:hypothetical protein
MKRTPGIGLVLALVTAVFVYVTARPRVPYTAARDGDVVAQRVAPLEEKEKNEEEVGEEARQQPAAAPIVSPVITTPPGSAAIEQTAHGAKSGPLLVESFDGLGVGFAGPQGTANLRNPSDNTLAVGPNHIVQIVNSQTAIFTKKGKKFDTTGRVVYGPVPTANFFKGFGGQCEATNNGDAVARYDQVANRWLVVMPLFRRGPVRPDQPEAWTASDKAYVSPVGMPGQPGKATPLFLPPPPPPEPPTAPGQRGRGQAGRGQGPQGPYSMCYAISTSDDPMGSYYRYEFLRPLFPDYPRPAIWRDGYYVPTSTSDDFIQKHACVVEREKMLRGEPASEQCIVLDGVGFLNNADVDGKAMPPSGAPQHHDDGRWIAARERARGRWRVRLEVLGRLEGPREYKSRRAGEDRGRAVSLSVRRTAQELRAAAGHRPSPRFAGRQDHVAPRLPPDRRSRVCRRRALREYDGRRRRSPLV